MFFAKKCILSHEGHQELSFRLWKPVEANQYPGACTQYKVIFTHLPFSKISQVILKQINSLTKATTKTNKQANKSPTQMKNNNNNIDDNKKETLPVKTVMLAVHQIHQQKTGHVTFPVGSLTGVVLLANVVCDLLPNPSKC